MKIELWDSTEKGMPNPDYGASQKYETYIEIWKVNRWKPSFLAVYCHVEISPKA